MAEFKDLKVFKIDQNPLEWPVSLHVRLNLF